MIDERIQVWPENRWYWQYRGKPVLLLGGSDEDDLFNHPELNDANLKVLGECGGNYIRQTLSSRDEGAVKPFLKVGDRYDLDKPNPEFWDRLTTSCVGAYERDIIVQVELWATHDFYRTAWLTNPWNPVNNVNYTTETTKLEAEWEHHPYRNPQPFFRSVPELNNDTVLLAYQERFVCKVLDATIDLPNVLYCLDNETNVPPQWPWYWAQFLADESEKRGLPIQVTEMWGNGDLAGEQHRATYERPDLFSYMEVSQNNTTLGETHYDALLRLRWTLEKHPAGPRPMNNTKVYMTVFDGSGRPVSFREEAVGVDRWWQNVFAGCASTRFHRPLPGKGWGLGLGPKAQRAIRAARTFTGAFDVFHTEPHPELLSEREENEAYCLAKPGEVYAVYFPRGGSVRLDIPQVGRPMTLRWFDPTAARFADPHPIEAGVGVLFKTPSEEQTWLALIK